MPAPLVNPASLYAGDPKTFTVRLSGAVQLYGPEIKVIGTREFQRLDGLRQLGTAHLVFRSANHTRFEHSLGTLHEVQRIMDAVNRNPRAIRRVDPPQMRVARLTALLHDLVHIPYAHTLEDEFGLLPRHDRNRGRRERLLDGGEIGEILRESLKPHEYEMLIAVLEAQDDAEIKQLGEWAFVADLVSNTVCADALDYVPRDLTGCGMPVALGDRFLDFFVVMGDGTPSVEHQHRMALRLDKRGMPRPDVESEVHKLLEHRYELVERVFFHHGKNAASAMLARAVQELGLHERDENFDWLSDELLRLILSRPELAGPLGLAITEDPERRALAAELANAVNTRRLYKLAYLGVPEDDVERRAKKIVRIAGEAPEERRVVEDELAALSSIQPGNVLLHVPSPRMLAKKGNVRVMLDNGDVVFLSEWDAERSRRIEALRRAHARLWRISVYAHPSCSTHQLRLLSRAAEDRFELRPRYVKQPPLSPYFGELFDQNAEARGWVPHLRTAAIAEADVAAAEATVEGRDMSRSHEAMLDLLDIGFSRARLREQHERHGQIGQDMLFRDAE